jgi:site-specific recombinase XerD
MAFIDSPEAKRIASKISDKTVTIGEFLLASTYELTNKGKHEGTGNLVTRHVTPLTNTLKKALPKFNLTFDSPWTSLLDVDLLKDFDDLKEVTSSTLQHFQNIERETEDFFDNHKRLIDNPQIYPFSHSSTMISGVGNLYRKKVGSSKGSQTRKSNKLKGVPKASSTIPKLLGVINKIPTDSPNNVKSAVLFNMLMPYRPGEVAGLRISDVDFEEGVIAEWSRGQKTRNTLVLSKTALGVLKDAVEKAKDHPSNQGVNNLRIFPDLKSEHMTKALNKAGFKTDFKVHEATLGRELKGISDLRKLIPSLLAHQLGANIEVVSEILGHADIGQINTTLAHYVSAVQSDELQSTRALRILENLIGFHSGAVTLNEIPTLYGVSAEEFTSSNDVIDITDPDAFRAEQITSERPLTPEDIKRKEKFTEQQDARLAQSTEESLLAGEEAKQKRLILEAENAKQNATQKADNFLDDVEKTVKTNAELNDKLIELEAIPIEERDPVQSAQITAIEKKLKIEPKAPEVPVKISPFTETPEQRVARILNPDTETATDILKRYFANKTIKNLGKKLAITAITGGATAIPTVADAAVDLALSSGPTGDTPNLEDSTQAELLELLESEKRIDTREPVANFASRRLEENLAENKAFEARRNNPETTALKEDMDKVFGKKPLAKVIDKRDKESLDTSTRKIEEGLAKYNNSSLLKEYSGFATRP